MRSFFILVLIFSLQFLSAQSPNPFAAIDAKISKIPDSLSISTSGIAKYINANFTWEEDKIRAAFYWTASNISYDVVNMNEPNFVYSPQEKIASALKTKKGVCIHYAEVFNEIAHKINMKTYIVGGYTKQNGKVTTISHAWCAGLVDGKWFLFDPTWASGYVDGTKFVKKLNNNFYKVLPSKMVQTHMPFDYIWQLSNAPITNNEFYSGKITTNKPNFDFETEIQKYEKLPVEEQAFQTSVRVEKNGIVNNLISDYFAQKKDEFTIIRQNKNIEKLNEIVTSYNETIFLLNDFILYRNKMFKPTLPDSELKSMVQTIKEKFTKCQNDIYALGSVGSQNAASFNSLKRAMMDTINQANEQEAFVNEYLTKSKGDRKRMFTKVTWLGIPIR